MDQKKYTKRYYEVAALAEKTAKKVIRNGESWMKYLDTASRLYKYSFEKQLLIYAQRPDATACATMEIWNGKMNCWVNRGAKGIALLEKDSPSLTYVFDVSDVHKAKRIGKEPYLWKLEDEHKSLVLQNLEATYGETKRDTSFESRIIEMSRRIAEDVYEELLSDILYVREGSFLEELDDFNLGIRLRDTLASSMAYTLLARCGSDMKQWADEFNFEYINDFNTSDVLSVFGSVTTELCKPILMEIGKIIRNYEQDKVKNQELENQKKIFKFSIENTSEIHYNTLKRESDIISKKEEGVVYEDYIRKERGLSDSQYYSEPGTGATIDQVRKDENGFSGEESQRSFLSVSSFGKIKETLPADSGTGRGESRLSGRADGESRGSERGTESHRPDEMGGSDEQYQTFSGRNRVERADLHFELEKEKELDSSEKSLESGSFSIPPFSEELLDLQREILSSDRFLRHKRTEISGYFQMESSSILQEEYLKNSYRMNEFTELNIGKDRAGYYAEEDGITIWKGSYLNREAECRLTWEEARYWVNAYLEDGVYLKSGEVAENIESNGMFQQMDLFSMFSEQVGNIAMKQIEEPSSIMPLGFTLPEKELDTILRTGGGKDHSRKRIYAKYQQRKTPKEMEVFLRQEYATTGKGFDIDGKQIAVWFDESGMRVGYGTSATEQPLVKMDWKEIESHIRRQVENGTYMSANEAYLVDSVERERIATHINNFFRDGISEIPENLELKFSNYPKSMEKLCELLSTHEGRLLLIKEIEKARIQLESGEKHLKWNYVKEPDYLLQEITDLDMEKREYPVSGTIEVKQEDFITQDEIDFRLTKGSGIQHGKFRIYEYFMEGHDKKANVDFLKNEYGIGGSSHALPGSDSGHEDHDAKGIRFEKGSYVNPYAKVLLNWNVVESRIRKLVNEDKYLSLEGKEEYIKYREKEDKKILEKAQKNLDSIPKEEYIEEKPSKEDGIRKKITVAIESTEDFSDPEIGFYTYQYPDGREGVRYRLVTTAENGVLIPYPEHNKFFINRELLQEYIDLHTSEIEVINYDNMVYRAASKIQLYKQEHTSPEIISNAKLQNIYQIYQLKADDELRGYRFENFEYLKSQNLKVESKNYDLKYEGEWEDGMDIEQIFTKFNIDRPKDFTGHSLSVGDIVVLNRNGEKTAHFVDSVGFKDVPEFLQEVIPEQSVHYDELMETADAVEQTKIEVHRIVSNFKKKTDEMFHVIEGQNQEDIEQTVSAYVMAKIEQYELPVEVIDVVISGSRCRGMEEENSDLDVVVEYKGKENEDHLFNIFHEDGLKIGDVKVDINPITEEKTGTLATYLPEVESYLAEKRENIQKETVTEREQKETVVTLTVAECGEFHNLGEFHEDVETVDEAIAIFGKIPPDRMNGIPTIGIKIHTPGTDPISDVSADLVNQKRIDIDYLQYVPQITNNPKAMKFVAELIAKLPNLEIEGNLSQDLEVKVQEIRTSLSSEKAKQPEEITKFIGKELFIGIRRYKIESIEESNGEVLLCDITFQNNAGVPIFRIEQFDKIKGLLEEQKIEVSSKELQQVSNVIQEKPKNFHILTPQLEETRFSPKEKFRQNVGAIRTLEKIESEHRIATPEEQEILSNYVGWGGLADAFDETKANWASEYQELKSLLSSEEYASARESTLNAHYTSPVIIKAIYDAIAQMGFSNGNILEPAMGIGNFFGMLPEKMQKSRLYGVELDSITGRIAKQLYPNADIKITGFEKTDYPNDFFDVAIGNVPFGQYKVSDKKYDKHNFLIHDYFFAKTLDKVRPGGVIAFITSKGTMDKKSPEVRKYLAQRAELLGAIRLPNTAFKGNAGTEVTSDIIFLKKRDRIVDQEPDWVHLSEDENGIVQNSYFVEHPEMIMGTMETVSGPYGMEATCMPDSSIPLSKQIEKAIFSMEGSIDTVEIEEAENSLAEEIIPADPDVKNYSYTIVDDKVYYRENSIMKPVDVSESVQERMKGMIGIRNVTKELILMQLEEFSDAEIEKKQIELNKLYDDFQKKHGLINSQSNKRAFREDSSYSLLCSLEKVDEEGNFKGKADMFTKRTIKKAEVVTSVDTASESLTVSLAERAKIDLDYMADLTGKSLDTIKEELAGVIFQNPLTDKWETADEYLSGNVREKLAIAQNYAKDQPEYEINVQALTRVQPQELEASEIEVRIGATWIESKYIEDFMREVFQTPPYLLQRNVMGVDYSDVTAQWNIKGKNADYGNSLVYMTYGTGRRNAYHILEDSLNLKDSRIFDIVMEEGKEKRVLNKKETMLASQKQESIREAFRNWIFENPERRQHLVEKYNGLFNSTRPREYDGSHLKFPGMTPDIQLKPHQKNAVAHVLYGNNTLLAHCVGAGKTFEMTAAAMESKRLGLCQKSLFVVPNHLTEQWASDFLRLYPGANILAATKKDFEPANRKKFCSRIATGDYDAVIIGHSQFEKIPLSEERQIHTIERQISEIETAIIQEKESNGERYTIKQMEKSKKALQTRLQKLNDTSRKDNVVTFEQLGVDRLFVDESHNYKNLFLYTKMRNVAGIAQTEAQKSSDMFAKCQYLDELTGSKGITFATGTPISNSMTELYTNMRYLQYDTLQKLGLGHFDSWASSFGETQTAIELAPEGTGYRAKTRFAKFFNLPELISLFKESADIQTPDMLKLPVPEAEYENVVLKPSEYQKEMVASLAERAEAVRDRRVDSAVDNMLKITNDGRKLALDQRLMNEMLPDEEQSKAAICVNKAFEIWEETKEQRSTQLIFCDLSTPKGDGTFNVYEDIREKLIEKGVPKEEIAFIHDANTELRKAELFAKVRSGHVRFLLGSTAKMGAGTNVQDRLIALHHLDVPWRPSDIEQQEGRILRQGNQNEKVKIFRYVTEGTFDSYSWQVIENKQKFIGQIMTSKSPVRSCEDVDEAALSYAEVKALATGNPYIKEKMDLDIQVSKLKLMKANHTSQKYRLEDNIAKHYPQQIAVLKERIEGMQSDIVTARKNIPVEKEQFFMKVANKMYTDKKEAGAALLEMCREMKSVNTPTVIGEYAGFQMAVSFDSFNRKFVMNVKGKLSHNMEVGPDSLGNITRMNNLLESMPRQLEEARTKLSAVEHQLEIAKIEVTKPFPQEEELLEKSQRLSALDALLNMDEKPQNDTIEEKKTEMENIQQDSMEETHKEIKQAFFIQDYYIRMESCELGLEYSIYDKEYHLYTGGILETTQQESNQSLKDILKESLPEIPESETPIPLDYEEFLSTVTETREQELKKIQEGNFQKKEEKYMLFEEYDFEEYDFKEHDFEGNHFEEEESEEYMGDLYKPSQYYEILTGIYSKIDVSIYADPNYDAYQMCELRFGLEAGIDVSVYADPNYNDYQMCELRLGLEAGIDVSVYADPNYNESQMYELRLGLEKGLDVSIYADSSYTSRQMQELRLVLEQGLDVSSYANSSFSIAKMENYRENILTKAKKEEIPIKPPSKNQNRKGPRI